MAMKERYYTVDGQMIGYKDAGGRLDFLTDALGSVTAEVDQTGATKTFDGRYKPYGGDLSSTGTRGSYGWVGTWGYRGTGLSASSHYVRARHYSKTSGNWTTIDLLWPEQMPYGYANGRTTRTIDPSGLGDDNNLADWLGGWTTAFQKWFEKQVPSSCPNDAIFQGNKPGYFDNVGGWTPLDLQYGNCCGYFAKCWKNSVVKIDSHGKPDCIDLACAMHDYDNSTVFEYGHRIGHYKLCAAASKCDCSAMYGSGPRYRDCLEAKQKIIKYGCFSGVTSIL